MNYCRYAPSLGELEGTPQQVWGTPKYVWWKHRHQPTVFFGLYDLRDYLALWQHRGKKWVLWAGSDIRNLEAGFLLNDGKLRTLSILLKGWFSNWIKEVIGKAENWTENVVEKEALERLGIRVANMTPSFMGDITAFTPYYRLTDPIHVYACSPQGREEEYGWAIIEEAAKLNRKIIYHLYGSRTWRSEQSNVVCHGRISKKRMNAMTKDCQVALRLNAFDGFSEIVAKGFLSGQHVVSATPYPFALHVRLEPKDVVKAIDSIRRHARPPNPQANQFYRQLINLYPWVNYANISNRSR